LAGTGSQSNNFALLGFEQNHLNDEACGASPMKQDQGHRKDPCQQHPEQQSFFFFFKKKKGIQLGNH
jgi:hypothetical protein